MAPREREAWIALAAVDGIGPVTFRRLVDRFGSAAAVIAAARDEPSGEWVRSAPVLDEDDDRPLISPELASAVSAAAGGIERLLESLAGARVEVVVPSDACYPVRLRRIELPPPALFVRGRPDALDGRPAVAVVGTRRPTEAGRRVSARIVASLAELGVGVVSGLALGIDGVAHATAVACGAPTVAVIGGGHRHLYPRGHASLAERILAREGALVSEHRPDVRPSRGSFPRRNRIISGMADATVVVEAGVRSGALTTAAWALEQGRPLFLVPGSIDSPESAGCLAFLREFAGEARIVAGVAELIEDLASLGVLAAFERPAPGGSALSRQLATLSAVERAVVGAVARGSASVDQLVAVTGAPAATVLGTLTVLEVRGLVEPAFGRYRLAGVAAALGPRRRAAGRSRRPPVASVATPRSEADGRP